MVLKKVLNAILIANDTSLASTNSLIIWILNENTKLLNSTTPLPSSNKIVLGCLVGVLSSACQSIGLILQRKSHLIKENSIVTGETVPPYKRSLWHIGFLLFIISNIFGSSIQITTLPLIILSPLQSIGLVFNTIFNSLILNEEFTHYSLSGTILISIGAFLIAFFGGAIVEPEYDLDKFIEFMKKKRFINWIIFDFLIVLAFLSWIVISSIKLNYNRRLYAISRNTNNTISNNNTNTITNTNNNINNNGDSTNQDIRSRSTSNSGVRNNLNNSTINHNHTKPMGFITSFIGSSLDQNILLKNLEIVEFQLHYPDMSTSSIENHFNNYHYNNYNNNNNNNGSLISRNYYQFENDSIFNKFLINSRYFKNLILKFHYLIWIKINKNFFNFNAEHIRKIQGVLFGSCSGILSAHSLLLAKSTIEILILTFVNHELSKLNHPTTYLLVISFFTLCLSQLYLLNQGLKFISTSILYPLVFCVYNMTNIGNGLIFYNQLNEVLGWNGILILLGTILVIAGVFILSYVSSSFSSSNNNITSDNKLNSASATPLLQDEIAAFANYDSINGNTGIPLISPTSPKRSNRHISFADTPIDASNGFIGTITNNNVNNNNINNNNNTSEFHHFAYQSNHHGNSSRKSSLANIHSNNMYELDNNDTSFVSFSSLNPVDSTHIYKTLSNGSNNINNNNNNNSNSNSNNNNNENSNNILTNPHLTLNSISALSNTISNNEVLLPIFKKTSEAGRKISGLIRRSLNPLNNSNGNINNNDNDNISVSGYNDTVTHVNNITNDYNLGAGNINNNNINNNNNLHSRLIGKKSTDSFNLHNVLNASGNNGSGGIIGENDTRSEILSSNNNNNLINDDEIVEYTSFGSLKDSSSFINNYDSFRPNILSASHSNNQLNQMYNNSNHINGNSNINDSNVSGIGSGTGTGNNTGLGLFSPIINKMQRSSSGLSTNANNNSNNNRLSPNQKKDFRNETSPLIPQRSIFRNNNIDKEISDSNSINKSNNEILQSLVQNESISKSNKKLKNYGNVIQNNKLSKMINTDNDSALGLGLLTTKDSDTNEESNEELNEDNEEHEEHEKNEGNETNDNNNLTVVISNDPNPILEIMPVKSDSNSDKIIPPLIPPPTAITNSLKATTATTTADRTDRTDSANGGNITGNTTFTSGRGLELSLNTTFNNSMNNIQPIPSALNAIVSEEEAVSQMIKDDTNHLSAISSSFSALQNGFMNSGLINNGNGNNKNQSSDNDESDYNPNHSYNYSLNNTIEEIQNQMNVYTVQSELLKKTDSSSTNNNGINSNNNPNTINTPTLQISKKTSRGKLNNENELRYSPLDSQPNNYYPTINSKRLSSITQKKRNKSISKDNNNNNNNNNNGSGSTPNSKNSTPQIGVQRVFSYEQYELFNELKGRN
ncbi:hypothetical protein B5S32_g5461 [[Candida] boidinii]|nr:hypothetical protein B5S32_g5461 [[Candida] boidinii]